MTEDQPQINETQDILDIRGLIDVSTIVKVFKSDILGGNINITKAGVVLKKMAKASEELLKDEQVKRAIVDDADKYLAGQKSVSVFGATITKAATYTFYDYTNCGDPVLTELYTIRDKVKLEIEIREAALKLLIREDNKDIKPNPAANGGAAPINLDIPNNGRAIIIETTPKLEWIPSGEAVEVQPPLKRQTIGLKYSKL